MLQMFLGYKYGLRFVVIKPGFFHKYLDRSCRKSFNQNNYYYYYYFLSGYYISPLFSCPLQVLVPPKQTPAYEKTQKSVPKNAQD